MGFGGSPLSQSAVVSLVWLTFRLDYMLQVAVKTSSMNWQRSPIRWMVSISIVCCFSFASEFVKNF